jgi:hypothetical protein
LTETLNLRCNYDDFQATADVGDDDAGNGGGSSGDCDDEDDDNEDSALWVHSAS